MSRIQDILAKAERDGTTRRSTLTPAAPTSSASPMAPIDGTAALDPSYLPPMPHVSDVMVSEARPAAPATTEPRSASATLHPALVAAINPHSPVAEQYRAIRTRLAHRDDHGPLRTIMVTSPEPGDGKSITSANLALTMAQELQRQVLLVDADLRTPATHLLFGVHGTPGLAEVLVGDASIDDALVYLPDLRLTILPAGNAPGFPTELLGSNAMRRVMDTLRARFDRILLDVPAVAPLADAGTLAPLADGVVMVIRAGVTQRPALDQALSAFTEGHVVGMVLNEVQ